MTLSVDVVPAQAFGHKIAGVPVGRCVVYVAQLLKRSGGQHLKEQKPFQHAWC